MSGRRGRKPCKNVCPAGRPLSTAMSAGRNTPRASRTRWKNSAWYALPRHSARNQGTFLNCWYLAIALECVM